MCVCCAYVHACICLFVHACMRTYVRACACVCTYVCMYVLHAIYFVDMHLKTILVVSLFSFIL